MYLLWEEPFVAKLLSFRSYDMTNNFFGKLKKAEWVLHIRLDNIRETQVQSCFKYDVKFLYPNNIRAFEDLLEKLKYRMKASENDNVDRDDISFYGENEKKRSIYCYG